MPASDEVTWMCFTLQGWQLFVFRLQSVVVCLDTSTMSVCGTLCRLFAVRRLPSMQRCVSTRSLQFPRRTFYVADRSSLTNCCTSTVKTVSVSWSKRESLYAAFKCKAPRHRITWQCGFHTTPRRNIPPVFWVVIKPLAKVASMLSGRWIHVSLLYVLLI